MSQLARWRDTPLTGSPGPDLTKWYGRASGRAVGALVLLMLAMICLLAGVVVAREGNLRYDDTFYLERGLYHAHQVQAKGDLHLPRLVYSLSLEPGRPPLFHGWVALGALAGLDANVPALLLFATIPPFLALCALVFWAARIAAGTTSGALAVSALVAMPLVLSRGASTMVDTSLAALVAAALAFALARVSTGKSAFDVAFGVSCGLGVLAKLTMPLFAGVLGIAVAIIIQKRESTRRALRFLVVAGAVAATLGAGWYARNGVEALAYARTSSVFEPCADTGSPWTRPGRLLLATTGPIVAAAGALLIARRLWRLRAGAAASPLEHLVMCSTLPGVVVVCLPTVFEPRYFLPALGPLAVWLGVEMQTVCRGAARQGTVAVGAVLCAGLLFSSGSLLKEESVSTPWAASLAIETMRREAGGRPLFCVLGNSNDWNAEKVRLVVELGMGAQRVESVDVLRQSGQDVAAILSRCEWVFVLERGAFSGDRSQRLLNRGYEAAASAVEAANGLFEREPQWEGRLATDASVKVYRRRR